MSNQRTYYVYIMSNTSKTLYVGVTSDLERRVWEHRQKHMKGFTQTYNCTLLVYFESCSWVDDAIARETNQGMETRQEAGSDSRDEPELARSCC